MCYPIMCGITLFFILPLVCHYKFSQLESTIPTAPTYRVYISQLIRYF